MGAFMRFYHETLFNPHWGESVSFRADNALLLNMAFQGLDQSEADAAWKPFLDFLTSSPQDFVISEALKITAIPSPALLGSRVSKEGLATYGGGRQPDRALIHRKNPSFFVHSQTTKSSPHSRDFRVIHGPRIVQLPS
jgi:hypothetical protein